MLLTPITRLNAIPLLKSNSQMLAETQRLECYIFMVMIWMSHPQSASTHCFNDQTGEIWFSGDRCCSLFFGLFTRCRGKAIPLATNSHPLLTTFLKSKLWLSAPAVPVIQILPLSSSSILGGWSVVHCLWVKDQLFLTTMQCCSAVPTAPFPRHCWKQWKAAWLPNNKQNLIKKITVTFHGYMETAIKFLASNAVSQSSPQSCWGTSPSWDRSTVITLNALDLVLGTQVATA